MEFFKFLTNYTAKKADITISISKFLKKELKKETGVNSKVIYDKIIDLKNAYTVYDNLKKSLGITNDFLFKTKDLVGTEIEELSVNRNIPQGINVESREIPIRVINNSGQIQELILNIRVW